MHLLLWIFVGYVVGWLAGMSRNARSTAPRWVHHAIETLLGAAAFGFCSIKGRCEETTRRVGQRQKAVRQATRKHHGFGDLKCQTATEPSHFHPEGHTVAGDAFHQERKIPAGWRVVKNLDSDAPRPEPSRTRIGTLSTSQVKSEPPSLVLTAWHLPQSSKICPRQAETAEVCLEVTGVVSKRFLGIPSSA